MPQRLQMPFLPIYRARAERIHRERVEIKSVFLVSGFRFRETRWFRDGRARFVDNGRVLDFHRAGRLDVIFVVVAITTDAAHLIAVVGLLPSFIDLLFRSVFSDVLCEGMVSTLILFTIVSFF